MGNRRNVRPRRAGNKKKQQVLSFRKRLSNLIAHSLFFGGVVALYFYGTDRLEKGDVVFGLSLFFLVLILSIGLIYQSGLFENLSSKLQRICYLVAGGLIAIGLVATWAYKKPIKPDVTLHFIGPGKGPTTFPALQVVRKNNTDAIAREMRYKVTVWLLDLRKGDPKSPSRVMPLCRFQRGELGGYIEAHQESDPEIVFESCPEFYLSLLPEDRLLGFAHVTCAGCARGHGYWLYKVWGQSGWYAETADGSDPEPKFWELFRQGQFSDMMTDTEKFFQTLPLLERKQMSAE